MSHLSFCHTVFKCRQLQMRQNASTSGKGLNANVKSINHPFPRYRQYLTHMQQTTFENVFAKGELFIMSNFSIFHNLITLIEIFYILDLIILKWSAADLLYVGKASKLDYYFSSIEQDTQMKISRPLPYDGNTKRKSALNHDFGIVQQRDT